MTTVNISIITAFFSQLSNKRTPSWNVNFSADQKCPFFGVSANWKVYRILPLNIMDFGIELTFPWVSTGFFPQPLESCHGEQLLLKQVDVVDEKKKVCIP